MKFYVRILSSNVSKNDCKLLLFPETNSWLLMGAVKSTLSSYLENPDNFEDARVRESGDNHNPLQRYYHVECLM